MINNFSLCLYCLFVISWFLHLGTRIPLLGAIRIDFILIIILSILAFLRVMDHRNNIQAKTDTDKWLKVLIIYVICSIPFVEWPGSVINSGIENWIKVSAFYYFTITFIGSEKDLKSLTFVFLACQTWRFLEPLYLHITEDYWGDMASMADWETMYRLAGAPSDVINPNGLAFVICTVLPFLYFTARLSWKNWLISTILISLALYTLMLTGSRSGFIGIIIIFLGIIAKSKKRLLICISGILLLILSFPFLSSDMQDRYLSIVGAGPKNEVTAEGRWSGVINNFAIGFRRPIFGHGLGTSREVNANFGGNDQPAHNLYAEVFQELGLMGLIIFALFIKSIFIGFSQIQKADNKQNMSLFLQKFNNAMQVWLAMNLAFSFASFGLNSYEWYLFAGFSIVVRRLAVLESSQDQPVWQRNHTYKRRRSRRIKVQPVGN
ncbi:MAG: O-antigen ligase family protein [Candidatus Competibacteraceae bacterium]